MMREDGICRAWPDDFNDILAIDGRFRLEQYSFLTSEYDGFKYGLYETKTYNSWKALFGLCRPVGFLYGREFSTTCLDVAKYMVKIFEQYDKSDYKHLVILTN